MEKDFIKINLFARTGLSLGKNKDDLSIFFYQNKISILNVNKTPKDKHILGLVPHERNKTFNFLVMVKFLDHDN